VAVDGPGATHAAIAPDRAQQLLLRPDAGGLDGEHAQELELLLRQLDRLAVQQDAVRRGVDLQRAGADEAERPAPAGAPEERVDAGAQLRVGERLAEVVVGPAVEAADAVDLRRPPGEEQDGRRGVHAAREPVGLPEPAQQVQPAGVREDEVEQHEVGVLGLQQPDGIARAVARDHVVAVGGEVVGEERAGRGVVLDDEDGGGVVGHASTRHDRRRFRPLSPRPRPPRPR
jgi:hypothetical protein